MTVARLGVLLIAGLAGLLFGFDTAVISGVTGALRQEFGLTPGSLGVVVSAALWGTLVGSLGAGIPGDRWGTRDSMRLIGVLYIVSSVGCAIAPGLVSFTICRFLCGLAIGASSVLAPVYLTEMAPAAWRGAAVGLFQFNIVFGILAAYLSNFLVAEAVSGPDSWRWKMVAATLPALLFLLLLLTIPQSPRWLATKGRRAEAEAGLARLGMADASAALQAPPESAPRLSWEHHRRPITLAILLAFFNQFSGINAILYYLNDIFAAAGFGAVSADLQSVAIGATNLVATVVAMLVIDRVGRRTLLLTGAIGMGAALAGVAAILAFGQDQALLIWMLIAFIACFAFSQGAVIWVYLAEIFPTPVRARGQSIGSAAHWIFNALIAGLFPVVAASTRALPFVVFSLCMALQFFVVWRWFPETRRIELEQLFARLDGGRIGR